MPSLFLEWKFYKIIASIIYSVEEIIVGLKEKYFFIFSPPVLLQ